MCKAINHIVKIALCVCLGVLNISCQAKPKADAAQRVIWLGYHETSSAIYPTVHYDFQREFDGSFTLINCADRAPEEALIAAVPAEVSDRLTEIVREEKMYRYREEYRPLVDIRDGSSWTLSVQFEDESTISSSGYAKRPRGNGLERLKEYLDGVWEQVKDSAAIVNLYEKY